MTQPKIVCVVGPTACGKTKMGVALAKLLGGEVVSVDSMQIYRGLPVGTAAPTPEEMEGVPHHMVAVAEPAENWSAARFVEAADRCIQDILARGKTPVLVGGTGLYVESIVAGRDFAAGQTGGEVRKALYEQFEREGIDRLWQELEQVDPESAERIEKNDTKRVLRALEVWRETGKTISAHNAESAAMLPKYDALWIGLAFADREDMRRRIDLRVDAMAEGGIWEEVRWLAGLDLPEGATVLQAIGYKELMPALRGEQTEAEALEELKLRSRQYAKRQLTWLRRNPAIQWILWESSPDFSAGLQKATEILAGQGLR